MERRIGALLASAILAGGMVASAAPAGQGTPAPPASWRTLATEPYRGKRDDISFADAAHGWYGTGAGDLFATDDGGAIWRKVASHPGTFVRAVGFADARTGFIGNVGTGYYPGVTDTTPLYRTDDGGATWTAVPLGGATVAGICAIDLLRTHRIHQGRLEDALSITAAGRVGGPAGMIRSTDGGSTWRVTDMGRWTGMILDVHFVTEQVGFVAASSARDVDTTNAQVLMTRDGGATWREVYRSARSRELIWKMSWPSAKIGYGTVQSYDPAVTTKRVIKTTDGGATWHELPLVDNGKAVELGIGFADARHGWVGTTVGGFETVDGGAHWTPAPIAVAANKFRIVPRVGGGRRVVAIGTQVQALDLP